MRAQILSQGFVQGFAEGSLSANLNDEYCGSQQRMSMHVVLSVLVVLDSRLFDAYANDCVIKVNYKIIIDVQSRN